MNDRLYRSMDDRVLAGVAGGLAEKMGIDPSIVRIVWALLVIASGGAFLLIYIVMAIVVPEEDDVVPYTGYPPAPPAAGTDSISGWEVPGTVPAPPPSPTPGAAPPSATPPPGAPPPGAPWTAADWRAQARAAKRAARAARRGDRGPGQASIVIGVVLILVGVWFLLEQYVPGIRFDRVWPLAILALGVVLLVFSFGGRSGPKGPGAGS